MIVNKEFELAFNGLKKILLPYSPELALAVDEADNFYLNTNFIMKNKKPMYFSSVKINKNYVSFHLMPVYVFPELLENMSLDLKRRMQVKSCFNFKEKNDVLFNELSELTNNGYLKYKKAGYL